MSEFFRETTFGQIIHYASGRRAFSAADQRDLLKAQKYTTASSVSTPRTFENGDTNSPEIQMTDLENGQNFRLVDWEENDPENPRNWSTYKKLFVTFEICFLTLSVYIGSAIYTAGLQGVAEHFGVSEVAALLGLTVFVLGYATGPMFLAPLSEMPFFGRNPIFIGTLLVFVLLQLGVIFAKNFGMLLAFRFLTGFVGSPVLATGGAAIADMYEPKKQAYGIGIWGIAAICGPVFGPLVGGFAVENEDWRWPIWELMWLSGSCLVFLTVFLPETSSSNIIYRRTVRYRKATGCSNLKCQTEIAVEGLTTNAMMQTLLIRPFTIGFTEPIVFLLNLYLALVYALLYLWFESFPIVFLGIYDFSLGTEGLAFLGILIGAILTIPPFFWYLHKYVEPLYNGNGEVNPEYRLTPAFVGAFFLPVCLFWFGWSARPSVHWIMPIIGSSFFSVGAFLLFQAVFTYLSHTYPNYVAEVFASNDLVRSSFGAAFPLFAKGMYSRLGVAWGSSLLGFLSIAFIPIPFVLYYYGERIRHKSRMARHDL